MTHFCKCFEARMKFSQQVSFLFLPSQLTVFSLPEVPSPDSSSSFPGAAQRHRG